MVQNRGLQLTTYFNETASQLEELQVELNNDVKVKVDEINDLSERLASLNSQIYNCEILGGDASTLRDERTLLVNRLSELGDVEYIEQDYGKLVNGNIERKVTIKFAGNPIVVHDQDYKLELHRRINKKNEEDIEGLYDVTWANGLKLNLNSGELKSTIEIRDGKGEDQSDWVKGVPYYIKQLNDVARSFALGFNEGIVNGQRIGKGHAGGLTFNSVPSDTDDSNQDTTDDSTTNATQGEGIRFFSIDKLSSAELINVAVTDADIINEYSYMTAKNISLSTEVLDDIKNLFKSYTDINNNNDTEGINSVLEFKDREDFFGAYNLEDCISGIITTLGVDAEIAKNLYTSHDSIMTQYENQRDSYSSVNLDEEGTNLIRYQEMYNAAAKMMSVFSEFYETLVSII